MLLRVGHGDAAGLSHIHRGRVSDAHSKTIATGWINAGTLESYLERL